MDQMACEWKAEGNDEPGNVDRERSSSSNVRKVASLRQGLQGCIGKSKNT